MLEQEEFEKIITESDESVVYNMIYALGGFIWRMEHDLADDRIPEADEEAVVTSIVRAREQIVQVVRSLTRFGVEEPIDSNGRTTTQYWSWYRWWNDYFQAMEEETWENYIVSSADGADLTSWRPEGTWKK